MKKKDKPLVAILSGGPSSEDYLSRRSCKLVFDSLLNGPYSLEVLDWHKNGQVEMLAKPEGKALLKWSSLQECFNEYKPDVVFNCLHGEKENAGQLQGFFSILGIPFTGNKLSPSVIGMDKILSKDVFRRLGIRTPRDFLLGHLHSIEPFDSLVEIKANGFDFPFIVKTTHGGASEGVALIENQENYLKFLKERSDDDSTKHYSLFIEEFIKGEEYSIGIFGQWYIDNLITMPLAKLVFDGKIFDKTTKFNNAYSADYNYLLPEETYELMKNTGREIHRVFKLIGFSRVDFILTNNFRIYTLEVNTHPGLSSNSIIPAMVNQSTELSLREAFLEMINWSISEHGK